MRTIVLSFILLAALAGSAAAQYGPGYYAQPPPPQSQGLQRGGVILGGAVGLGAIGFADCDDCDGLGGLALQGHIGGMVAPNLAIVFEGSTVIHPLEQDGVLSQNIALGALRVWLAPQLYLTGGLGLAVLDLSDDYGYLVARSETGFAGMVGGGIELLQTYNFALDLQVRVTGARIDYGDGVGIGTASVLLGFNWY